MLQLARGTIYAILTMRKYFVDVSISKTRLDAASALACNGKLWPDFSH
jgi:hypothetical protein